MTKQLTRTQCIRRLEEARKKILNVFANSKISEFTGTQQKMLFDMNLKIGDLVGKLKRK